MKIPDQQSIIKLCEKYDVKLLVLFGSAAEDPKKARDIDIGALFKKRIPARLELDFFYDTQRVFATDRLDVVVLDKAEPVLLKEVALNGRPLFESSANEFDFFIINAIAKYQETNENRRLANDQVGSFLSKRRRGA